MQLTKTAFGMWSGGRFMHFGEPLPDDRFIDLIRRAYEEGIRTFLTAEIARWAKVIKDANIKAVE